VSSKKATKAASKKPTKRTNKRTVKEAKFVEHMAAGESGGAAVNKSGWRQTPAAARVTASRLMADPAIAERVARRKAQAMARAGIHTDVIIGSLAEVSTASIGDVLDENGNFDMATCRARGTDHLLKKVTVTERHSKDGSKRVTYSYEMYSRLDALNQLRETFGMKQEARRNEADAEALRAEVEKSLTRIMERDGVDQATAATLLRGEMADVPALVPIIDSYVH
jgi:hypothetical protein